MSKLSLVVLDRFKKLYAKVPRIECKGLCQESCGMVPFSMFELRRVDAIHPDAEIQVVDESGAYCPYLNKEGRCIVHFARPLLCRLWGNVEAMACPHGCRPTKFLTDAEAKELMAEADRIGGGPTSAQMEMVYAASEKIRKARADAGQTL